MPQCDNLLRATTDTVVLGFKLIGYEANPERAFKRTIDALKSKEVEAAIIKALIAEATRLKDKQRTGGQLTLDDAKQMGRKASKSALSAGRKHIEKAIKKSDLFNRLERQLKDLECSFKKSPFGVWVNEEKGFLIVVASGLVIGAAAATYRARTGDTIAKLSVELLKDRKLFEIGGLDVGTSKVKFTPSKRELELNTFLKGELKSIKTQFDLQVGIREDEVSVVGGRASIVLPVGAKLVGGMVAKRDYDSNTETHGPFELKYDFALDLDLKELDHGTGLNLQFRVTGTESSKQDEVATSGKIQLHTKVKEIPMRLDAGAQYRKTLVDGQKTKNDFSMNIGVAFEF